MKTGTGILEYKLCIECKTGLVKNHGHYCKICKPKQLDKKLKPIEKNKKIYSYQFKNNEIFKASRVVLSTINFKKGKLLY
jgi:CxxC motif-containing protein